MVVFSIFFGALADVPSEGLPYPVFAFSGLVPWTFFQFGVTQAANSVVSNANLVSKVYFPRIIIPLSAVAAGLIDFLVAFVVLVGIMLAYGIAPSINSVLLPILIMLTFLAALGVGLWLSGINVYFRDVRHTTTFLVQLWLFLTPVAYPTAMLDGPWQTIYALNPMVGVIEGFRWGLFDIGDPPSQLMLVSTAIIIFLVTTGLWFFRRVEKTFADVV
jgi:lipopolysaccharide transport system permease protein